MKGRKEENFKDVYLEIEIDGRFWIFFYLVSVDK